MSDKFNNLHYKEGQFHLVKGFSQLLDLETWEIIKSKTDELYKNVIKEYGSIENYNDLEYERLKEQMKVIKDNKIKNRKFSAKDWTPNKDIEKGYLYFIRNSEGLTKIGYSTNINGRLETLRTASPYKMDLIASVYCENYKKMERIAHNYFSEKRADNGEWFCLEIEDIQIFLEHAKKHIKY